MKMAWKLVVPVVLLGFIALAGCKTSKPGATAEQSRAAWEGQDIVLGPVGGNFGEPLPEDALVLKEMHFDYDKSDIKDSEKPILDGINSWMLSHPQAVLQIEGHCDERGTKEYNMALGERRALSVRSYLVGLGVAPDRMQTISYGEEKPLCSEQKEECWVKNRRAHFLVDYGTGTKSTGSQPPTPMEAKQSIEKTEVVEKVVQAPREEMPMPEEESTGRDRAIGRYHY